MQICDMTLRSVSEQALLASQSSTSDASAHDLVSSLDCPSQVSPSLWTSRQLQACTVVQVMSMTPGSLGLFWRALQLVMNDVSLLHSTSVCIKPSLWCSQAPSIRTAEEQIAGKTFWQVIHSALSVVLLLVEGGQALSDRPLPPSILSAKPQGPQKSKKKKKRGSQEGGEEKDFPCDRHEGVSLHNMTLMMDAVCEVSQLSTIFVHRRKTCNFLQHIWMHALQSPALEERSRVVTERDIQAVRLDAHRLGSFAHRSVKICLLLYIYIY